jgi:hypothetical protein
MHATLSRRARAHQPVMDPPGARCRDRQALCPSCEAEAREIRAARRDAIIHSLGTRRHRRYRS